MWLTLAAAAWGAEPPVVEITWKKDRATLRIEAPKDQKIAPDAPARLALRWADRELDLASDGAGLARGIPMGDLRGVALDGALDVGLCDLQGTTCRPTRWSVHGEVPDGKRGWAVLRVETPDAAEVVPFGPDATADAATEAFARAKANGKAVMLDFSAVWCPPCNLLAAEVLHGERPAELESYEIAILDVDHASSFALKDRYAVGGYPTVVVVDADGTERSRTVGYTDRDAFLGWAANASTSNDAADLARPPSELAPDRAASLAWLQVQAGDEDAAKALLARAEGVDTVELRLARFALGPTPADLEWLVAHAPDRASSWVGAAVDLKEAPDLARKSVELALRTAEGSELAEVLSAAASLEDEAGARVLNGAAAAVVRSEMVGDPLHDKGYVTWLAHLEEESGDPEAAVALLSRWVGTHPNEPTFDLALAPLLRRLGRLDEALASAERAVALSWGDNRLRAVTTEAEILVALGRAPEAAALAEAELASQPAPEAGLDVRTHRYRTKLEAAVRPAAD